MATSFIELSGIDVNSSQEERSLRMENLALKTLDWNKVLEIMMKEYGFGNEALSGVFKKLILINPYEFIYLTEGEINERLQSLCPNEAEKKFIWEILNWIEVVLLMKYYKTQNPFETIRRIAMVKMMASVSKRERSIA